MVYSGSRSKPLPTSTPISSPWGLNRYMNCSDLVHAIGDGVCNGPNNNEECGYDGGDCCSCTCMESTTHSCGRTGYSCVDPSVSAACRDASSVVPSLARLADVDSTCEINGRPVHWIGDGFCDIVLNNALCGYDGGDCCSCTCVDSEEYQCGVWGYDCQDPDISSDCVNDSSSYVPSAEFATSVTSFSSDGSYATCAEDGRPVQWIGDGACDIINNYPDCGYDGGDCCLCTCSDERYECGSLGFSCKDPKVSPACVNESDTFVPTPTSVNEGSSTLAYAALYACILALILVCLAYACQTSCGRTNLVYIDSLPPQAVPLGAQTVEERSSLPPAQ